ncbi:MAG: hypothetical protein NUK57_08135 [Gudongella sp.]|nr:hypothetical protein [Gudongella sp.]
MGRIHIITGGWDDGKTTRLTEHFNKMEEGRADGFASVKVYDKQTGEFIGYSLRRLSTGEQHPLAIMKKVYKEESVDTLIFDRFVFLNETFRFAEKMLEDFIHDKTINAIFLDEIGPIELMGLGFHTILEKLLASSKDVYMAINECNLHDVTIKYNIEDFISM